MRQSAAPSANETRDGLDSVLGDQIQSPAKTKLAIPRCSKKKGAI